MRKLTLLLTLLMGVGFVACEPQGPEPTEPLYPSPEAVIVDDEACGENSITLLFDGSAAVKAGATTFTSALTPDDESEPITITREVTHQEACKHVYANLPTGVYTASVFATYPDGTSSEPVFVKDAKGAVVLLKIEGATLAVKHAYSTSSSLAFTWRIRQWIVQQHTASVSTRMQSARTSLFRGRRVPAARFGLIWQMVVHSSSSPVWIRTHRTGLL